MATNAPEIIEYSLPGEQPDTRLIIFNLLILHVHSTVLKAHSVYFRRFLDSPDKISAKAGARWKYEWVTEIESGGKWVLTAAEKHSSAVGGFDLQTYYAYIAVKLAETGQERTKDHFSVFTFQWLINAMYSISFAIDDIDMLRYLITKADFYLALPAVSKVLTACLLCSPRLLMNFDTLSHLFLDIACTLRHKELFNDCVIMISGYWDPNDTVFKPFPDLEEFNPLLETVHNRLGAKIAHLQHQVLQSILRNGGNGMVSSAINASQGSLVQYFSYLATARATPQALKDLLAPLIANDMHLPHVASGLGGFLNNFYCSHLLIEDLPWDVTQTEW